MILKYVLRSPSPPTPISTHTKVSPHFFLPLYWLPFKYHALKPLHHLTVFYPPRSCSCTEFASSSISIHTVRQCTKRPTATESQPLTLEHCDISIITSNCSVSSLCRRFKTNIKRQQILSRL